MVVRSRLQIVMCVLGLLAAAGSLDGCKKEKPQEKPAEVAVDSEAVKKSFDGLKPALAALNTKFTNLRKKVDVIPANVPGFADTRAKFFATDEALGVMGPKLDWLSGRLDSALKTKNREELAKVSKDIDKTYAELAEMDGIALQVLHEVLPYERIIDRAKEVGAEYYTHKLSSGFEVRAEKQGLEQRLIEFLDDPKQKAPKATWVDFDRVLFTGADINREASEDQLKSVAEILKAYPKAKIKLGGFTDNSGAPAANKALSAQRAGAVKKALESLGVAEARIESEGFGAEQALCPANDTEACKSKNRRISILVTAK